MLRTVNRYGFVSVQRFYIYAEDELSRQRVSIWIYGWAGRHVQLQQMEEMRRLLRERSDDGSAAVPYTW